MNPSEALGQSSQKREKVEYKHDAGPRRVCEVYEDLELRSGHRRRASRPFVAINMVCSVDGRVAAGGKASRIGGEADRAAMRRLRAEADAVVVGAGTLRAERLSLGLDSPRGSFGGPNEAREARGPQPLAVILTASGDVALGNLILEPGQGLLVFAADDAPAGKLAALRERGAAVIPTPKDRSGPGLDLREVTRVLAYEHGVEVLLAEGGPTINRALIDAGLVDELFLTLAPKLLAGPRGVEEGEHAEDGANRPAPKTIVEGEPFEQPAHLKLISVQAVGDELFLRYAL